MAAPPNTGLEPLLEIENKKMDSPTNTMKVQNNIFENSPSENISKEPLTLQKNISGNGQNVIVSPASSQKRILMLYVGGIIGKKTNRNRTLDYSRNSLESYLRTIPIMCDNEYAMNLTEPDLSRFIALPAKKSEARILYHIEEFDIIEPSSNITSEHWKKIASVIEKAYEAYDGFVILHGTDTMAYTASALSFMFENLEKTVVVTGSQISAFEPRSDGRDNIVGSLIIAGNFVIPEVTVYFQHTLYRGNRIVKRSTDALHAFESPNMLPLANIGINIEVNSKTILRPHANEKFHVHLNLNPNVGILRLFPNITIQTVKTHHQPPIEGVVLHTYGAGEIPNNRSDILNELKKASERGVIIVNCSQCMEGSANDAQETGKVLFEVGVISGGDMTVEAALTKLSYVLSKTEWDMNTKCKMLQRNLRGELTCIEKNEKCLGEINILKLEDASKSKEIVLPDLINNYVVEDNTEKLKAMKALNVNFSIGNSELRTPLHIACCEGKEDIVDYLLLGGASVHARDRFDNTPLMDAIHFDNHDIIKKLVKCGAHLVLNQPKVIGEELCSASARGDVKRMQSLQLAGADLGQPDFSGNTALHLAVLHARKEIVTYLRSGNVDVSAQNISGETPADLAQKMNYQDILQLLQ